MLYSPLKTYFFMSSKHFLRHYDPSSSNMVLVCVSSIEAILNPGVPSRARPPPAATTLSRNRRWIAIMFVSSFASEIPFG